MRNTQLGMLGAILVAFALGSYFYPQLPDRLATHWGMGGEADGYSQKGLGIFAVPLLMAAIAALFIVLPKIDPLRKNIEQFKKYYYWFALGIELFMLYLYALMLAWNLGFAFNFSQALSPAFAALFYGGGVLIENAKQNWSAGIRTPWTLSSKKVWEKTHKLGGKLFKAGAILALFGALFPQIAVLLIIGPMLLIAAFLFAYSYFEYKKEEKKK